MSLEGFPLAPVSNTGDRYLGTDARPEFLPNLALDDSYQRAARQTLGKTRTGEVISIPVTSRDLQDSMMGVNTRQVAPLDFAEKRTPIIAPDLAQAAMNHHVFGMGSISTFRSDKPQSGINFLRKQITVPADASASFNVPVVGPYNPVAISNKDLADPRYQAPTFGGLRPAM